jgi:hypothetical protein
MRLIPDFMLVFSCSLVAWNASEGEPLKSPKPLSPREELATLQVSKGFKVELVASKPDVVDPVALAFDEDGRLYVAEMRGYANDGVGTGNITSGKIKLLEDKNDDGVFETVTTFAENLRFPTTIMPWKEGVLVGVQPDIFYFERGDDGKGRNRRTLYTGFGNENIQQPLSYLPLVSTHLLGLCRFEGCKGLHGRRWNGDFRDVIWLCSSRTCTRHLSWQQVLPACRVPVRPLRPPGAWRFLNNERATLPALVEPLRTVGRTRTETAQAMFVLLVHDGCKLTLPSAEPEAGLGTVAPRRRRGL